ncbi:uncharacterized protein LOC110036731 [Phalaenopsis equestris]|uniref:uncharacterized protein LOC110036731 n=1 Tax=Phalaenopsis equestris TaxID=78828 RepID=UPI0009E5AEB7|nr:uncharacterized protein LOC110036731 [Phalaenopsis equestris]XP_020596903.1 uncharacterized protein LOC110036731 [Phalaenopsis equestris]
MGGNGRDDFFGVQDSFLDSSVFGRARSMSSNFFGGRNLFDDPFFADPFSAYRFRSTMGPSIFENSIFGSHGNPFGEGNNFEFLENHLLQRHKPSGPIIEEMSDDAENVETSEEHEKDPEKILSSTKEAWAQDPIEKSRGVKEHQKNQNELHKPSGGEPQTSKYAFHSSTTRYGGINGTYYTSSTTMRMSGDGVVVEERKEADASSGRATHRVSRGIQDRGHSFTRRLNSDGRVDTMQTLHNLNQDELPGFEAAWKGSAGETLLEWNPGISMRGYEETRRSSNRSGRPSKVIEIEAIPSTADQIEVSRTGSQT